MQIFNSLLIGTLVGVGAYGAGAPFWSALCFDIAAVLAVLYCYAESNK